MATNKLCEENNIDIDIPNTIKGLKAIQREAKKATRALKGLEEQQEEIIDLPARAEGSA